LHKTIHKYFLVGALVFGMHAAPHVTQAQDALQRLISLGQEAHNNGDMERAQYIFSRLLTFVPENEEVNFNYGLIEMELGNPSRAELAFGRTLSVNPAHHRARLELARALAALERYSEAQQELRTVLRADIPHAVRRNVEDYLATIQGRIPQRRTHAAQLEIGLFADSNVNVGPDTDIIPIRTLFFGPFQFTELELSEESRPRKDIGAFLNMQGRYAPTQTWQGWSAELGAQGYASRLRRETDYDLWHYQISATAIRRASRHDVRTPLRYAQMYQGGDRLMQSASIGARYTYRSRARQWISYHTELQFRDYAKQNDRDGIFVVNMLGIDQILGTRGHVAGAAIAHYLDRTEANVYQKNGIRLTLHGALRMPQDITYYAALHASRDTYDEREVLAPEDRVDEQLLWINGLRKPITDQTQMDLHHQYTNNQSTFALYEYARHVTTLSLTYRF